MSKPVPRSAANAMRRPSGAQAGSRSTADGVPFGQAANTRGSRPSGAIVQSWSRMETAMRAPPGAHAGSRTETSGRASCAWSARCSPPAPRAASATRKPRREPACMPIGRPRARQRALTNRRTVSVRARADRPLTSINSSGVPLRGTPGTATRSTRDAVRRHDLADRVADAPGRVVVFDREEEARLAAGRQQRRGIDRLDRVEVDDAHVHAVGSDRLRRAERLEDRHAAP